MVNPVDRTSSLAYGRSPAAATGPAGSPAASGCQACQNRKYQDVSNDPGVSFKSPTSLSPERAAVAVRAHEGEHVRNETARASSQGRRVVSQQVRVYTSLCPECGRVYVAGGQTATTTKGQSSPSPSGAAHPGTHGIDLYL